MVPADSTSASASHLGSMHSERYFRGEFAAQIQNLFDARGRETPSMLLFHRAARSSQGARTNADGKNAVERSHAQRTPRFYQLDRVSQTAGRP
jgi:hypothetical protein